MYTQFLLPVLLLWAVHGRRVHAAQALSLGESRRKPLTEFASYLLATSPHLGIPRAARPALLRQARPQMSAMSLAQNCLEEGCPVDMVYELIEYLKTDKNPSRAILRTITELEDVLGASQPNKNIMEQVVQGFLGASEPVIVETFGPAVESVEVMLKTDGSPLNARIELLEGPNRQAIDLYTESNLDRPLFAVIDTPGGENVVRLLNNAPAAPIAATVEPHSINDYYSPEY